jgi:UDP-N-acetylglucosamine 4,6-dehydratase
MKITDLARAIDPDCEFKVTGIRPGEKVHETLISEDESRNTKVLDDIYVIISQFARQGTKAFERYKKNKPVEPGFAYRSDKNDKNLTRNELQKILKDMV